MKLFKNAVCLLSLAVAMSPAVSLADIESCKTRCRSAYEIAKLGCQTQYGAGLSGCDEEYQCEKFNCDGIDDPAEKTLCFLPMWGVRLKCMAERAVCRDEVEDYFDGCIAAAKADLKSCEWSCLSNGQQNTAAE